MKKTEFDKPAYSVAMSDETGCIVMVKTVGRQVTVIGSLTHADSIKFADGVLKWLPPGREPETIDVNATLVN